MESTHVTRKHTDVNCFGDKFGSGARWVTMSLFTHKSRCSAVTFHTHSTPGKGPSIAISPLALF